MEDHLSNLVFTEYLARTLSDNAALVVKIPVSMPVTRNNSWRFASHLLNDTESVNRIAGNFLF